MINNNTANSMWIPRAEPIASITSKNKTHGDLVIIWKLNKSYVKLTDILAADENRSRIFASLSPRYLEKMIELKKNNYSLKEVVNLSTTM